MTQQDALYNYTARLGDNALVLGHRFGEWCSNGPLLEEDLALTNIALDLIGRAQILLDYAGKIEGKGRTADDLAYRRAERKFYNNLLHELPNNDFAYSMARLLFVAAYDKILFEELTQSSDPQLAAIAGKALKEAKYHYQHAADWVIRLGDGTEESNNRMQKAINALWMFTGELFEKDETDVLLIKSKIAVDNDKIRIEWNALINHVFSEATLQRPQDGWMQTGSRNGVHTEHLGHLLADMQYLQRAYPDAKW
jgi:ring-1,2-phenylacetyl-CoA epoxidase subunit PaaC